jgi:hypothetical protein
VDARRLRRTVDAISKIRIHPTNPTSCSSPSFGKYGADSDERGVFKTTDGGKTWTKVLFRDDKTGAVDIAIDRRNPNVMFAALWEAYRVEYQMSSGGPAAASSSRPTAARRGPRSRATRPAAGRRRPHRRRVSGADSNRVYALVENENGGLFASDDAGATWKLSTRTATSGSARSTTRTSSPTRSPRTPSTC